MKAPAWLAAGFLTLAALTPADRPSPETRMVSIVGACVSPRAAVRPHLVTVGRADEVRWRDLSGQASRFIVEPVDPDAWPFASPPHEADRGEMARSGRPSAGAPADQIYAYTVTLVCPGARGQILTGQVVIADG